MNPTIIGSQIIRRDRVSSTNDEADLLLSKGQVDDGTVITTRYQKAGRGHLGTAWESEPGKNLLLSIIFKPGFLQPADQFYISRVVALGAKDYIELYLDVASIKWPNDIYVGDDKIAGILIENVITGNQFTHAIGGLGININQTTFPEDIPNPTSLALILGFELDLNNSLEPLCSAMDVHYQNLRNGHMATLDEQYNENLYRLEQWAFYRADGASFEGKILGVEPRGELLMELRSGERRRFLFKELEYL